MTMWRSISVILASLLLMGGPAGCAVVRDTRPLYIALLAPFEGRYREVGYNALYAARLALADAPNSSYTLLPIEDGGTPEQAALRASALVIDERVAAVLVLGQTAAHPAVQTALHPVPAVIVGGWTDTRAGESTFVLSAADTAARLSFPLSLSITEIAARPDGGTVGEIGGLEGFRALRDSMGGITVLSSGTPPTGEFATRYSASGLYVPVPNLLAMLTYDATAWLTTLPPSRPAITDALHTGTYDSAHSGILAFNQAGWWQDAPVRGYTLMVDGSWAVVALDGVVE